MWEKQRNPNQLLSERAKNIVLSDIPITSKTAGKVRVSLASTARSQPRRMINKENNCSQNIAEPILEKEQQFSLKTAMTRNSYEFKPPAAAKYFLWDNTRLGNTIFCSPTDLLQDRITITSAAVKALRIELLKRNLIETANSTIIPKDVTGFLFGSMVREGELVLDRFDTGVKGRLASDHIISVLSGSFMVSDGFNYEELLKVL